jgi:hypothetical protein
MLRRDREYPAADDMKSTINVVEVANRNVFHVATQMDGRPGIVCQRNRQCSVVNSFGIIDPGGEFVTVSTNRYTYIRMMGAVMNPRNRIIGHFL